MKNLKLDEINSQKIRHFRKNINHAISGNEMKFKNDRIKYDNKWQKNMPLFNKLIVKFFNFNISDLKLECSYLAFQFKFDFIRTMNCPRLYIL